MSYFRTAPEILAIPEIRKSMVHDMAVAVRIYEACFKHFEPRIKINRQLLHAACAWAYCEIYSLTVFRGIEQADVHKRVAFLTKWITKLRPIYILEYEGIGGIPYINEVFAITFGLTTLNIVDKILDNTSKRNKYVQNLKYLLYHHSCVPEQFASEVFLLDEEVSKQ